MVTTLTDKRVPELSWLLRSWRETTAYDPRTVATEITARLSRLNYRVSEQAVRSWERPPQVVSDTLGRHPKGGEREPRHADAVLNALDDIYKTRGALTELARSLATPSALPAQRDWWHNYTRRLNPIWGWIRPEDGNQVDVEVEWGPVRFRFTRSCNPWGVILTCPACTHNPPIRLSFYKGKGWVDFGIGVVPSRLGRPPSASRVGRRPKGLSPGEIPVVQTLKLIRPAGIVRLFTLNQGQKSQVLEQWVRTQPGVRTALDFFIRHDPKEPADHRGFTDLRSEPTFSLPSDALYFSSDQWIALRKARRMSRNAVVAKVLSLDQPKGIDSASKGELAKWEDDLLRRGIEAGRRPALPHIGARLDTIYDAGGVTFREKVHSRPAPPHPPFTPMLLSNAVPLTRTYEVIFPQFWIGPVWVHFSNASRQGDAFVEMHWAPWARALRVKPGTTVWTRRSLPDTNSLLVRVQAGWTVTAGMGRYEALRRAHRHRHQW
jgi:hypothetical protein